MSSLHQSTAHLDVPDSSVLATIAISTSDAVVDVAQPLTSTPRTATQCQWWRHPLIQRLLITVLIIVIIILLETLLPSSGGAITSAVLSALTRLRNETDGAATAAAARRMD